MEDTQIVELYLKREENAIVQTAAQYGAKLRNISFGIVRDHETSEECENDTYLQAWGSIPPNTPHTYLFAYLACIIRHISIDRCRYQQRLCRNAYIQELSAELHSCIPGLENTEEQVEAIALGQSISGFLRQQPETARNVFLRRYWYMDSIADIADRFGISQSKAKSMLFRTRNALREFLEKEGYTL